MTNYAIRVLGDPVLKTRAKEVEDFDGKLSALTEGMIESMYDAEGVGLAAPQIGVQRRIITYDIGEGPQTIINPEVVETSGSAFYDEGCLSIPGLYFEIERPAKATFRGLDLHGNEVVFEDDDFLTRMMFHEIDHLDGILTIDRLDPDARKQAMAMIREQQIAGNFVARSRRAL